MESRRVLHQVRPLKQTTQHEFTGNLRHLAIEASSGRQVYPLLWTACDVEGSCAVREPRGDLGGTTPGHEDAMHREMLIFPRLLDTACVHGIVPNPFVFGALRCAGAGVIPKRCGK